MQAKPRSRVTLYLLLFLLVVWFAVLSTPCFEREGDIFTKFNALPNYLTNPFAITWMDNTPKYMLGFSGAYWLSVLYYEGTRRNTRNGEEHGSAQWANVKQLNKKYAQKKLSLNIILTENFRIGLNIFKHKHNLNRLIVGGPGSGKTRDYLKPNLLQANTSFIVTDPKGEVLKSMGAYLQRKGYELRVFDLINPDASMSYNPFAYIRNDNDILTLVSAYIRNTTRKTSTGDQFWERAEAALLQALISYLWHEAPESELNFATVLDMIRGMQPTADEFGFLRPPATDTLMNELRKKDPTHFALKQYDIFKSAPAETMGGILISTSVRLSQFGLPSVQKMTSRDELDFASIGKRKVALFALVPDDDTSFNFLISMMYTQAFQQLERLADSLPTGKLPVHVQCLMDEFGNIPLPDMFKNVLATARGREISISIILQSLGQLKALFDKDWEGIIGSCDEFLYLGNSELSTHEHISKMIGKQTIDTNTYGLQRGRNGHYNTNFQKAGRELMTPDEVGRIPRENALLYVANERFILDRKYKLLNHPSAKQAYDGGGAPPFDHRIHLARMYTNGLCPEDYEILIPNEEMPPPEADTPDDTVSEQREEPPIFEDSKRKKQRAYKASDKCCTPTVE